jgi:RNAse (barnase) inhibitor barstar
MIDNLEEIIGKPAPPYVLSVTGVDGRILERIVRRAAPDQKIAVLNGDRMRNWERFFSEFAGEFQFPDYFGNNINAFSEVMRDLEWIKAPGYVLLILNAENVLSEEKDGANTLQEYGEFFGEQWATPVQLGEWWDRGPVPFHTILQFNRNPDEMLAR